MKLKTVVEKDYEGVARAESSCWVPEQKDYKAIDLYLVERDYDEAFVQEIARQAAEYVLHTTYVYDYESSTDAGDGREEYDREEKDVEIDLDRCFVRGDRLYGVLCERFGRTGFVLTDCPKTVISHPGNYGGRGYHFYRTFHVEMAKKHA